jgi:UDP-N-acetylmuramoyl-L-alanyl-D-glutamate--2,6-diaminopimelate ligase
MKLGELLNVLERNGSVTADLHARDVTDVANDSRKVKPGSLFVAVRGFHSDGHQFIPQALRQGAVAVVAEQGRATRTASGAPLITVPDSRAALAQLAAAFFGNPSRKLKLIGITGTNGKTTTSYLVKSVIEAAGSTAGLIGTIDYRVGSTIYPAPNTTPESLDLQRLLAEMVGLGAGYCVMEVSSHALALGRTDGAVFEAAAFTNLTQDHLDFHKDMDSYFQAKLLLFTSLAQDKPAIVNIDDPRAQEIIGATRAKVITTGLSEKADIRPAGTITHGITGLSFGVKTPAGAVTVESPLVGRHNVYNILTAIGVGTALGFGGDAIARGIRNMKAVPGRMEKVEAGQAFGVVVDYAHTEDALVRLLEAVREVTQGRVITVFGCGGDRDRTKRPKMGAAAVKGSDVVIVTSDNPRTEDPLAIIKEIEAGMEGGFRMERTEALLQSSGGKTPYMVIPDRREAIKAAVRIAGAGDVVVLAGKGHEDYQIIGENKHHFDDRETAREAIGEMRTADRGIRNPHSESRN